MKYLVLTASTGAGHNQAAKNLKIEIEKEEDTCIIFDLFKRPHNKDGFMVKSYEIMALAFPDAYNFMYNISNNKYINNVVFKNAFMAVCFNLKKVIDKEKPNIIIATHPFAVAIVSRLKEIFNIDITFIQIITDFKAHYTYIDKDVDAYITASDYTKDSIIQKGINENRVYTYGIPVNDEFRTTNFENRINNKNILIMGGSLGINDMEYSVELILEKNMDVFLTIICGKNTSLQKRLTKNLKKHIISGRAKIYGFTDKINELMDESKLIITKPGGLTSSEAINKGLPMIIPFSFVGQEIENTSFLVESNVALEIKNIKDLPEYINLLMTDDEYYNNMINNMKNMSKNYSTKAIIDLSKKIYERKNVSTY